MTLTERPLICGACRRKLGLPSSRHLQVRKTSASASRNREIHTINQIKSRPLRLGVIGSGPAGFYAATRVMQKLQDARVDMYEKLPVPYGLVRYGVAPDHPEVKNCQDRFEEAALSDRFHFIGNAVIGNEISLSSLKPHYDAILFAYGASQDRLLGIPGEDLGGVHSAREFVGWYNGLPEFSDLDPDLESSEHAVVIGNGNVALDVARILLSDIDTLRKTDISEQALQRLLHSKVQRVTVVGRRGPMQAAFTIKEVRELSNLPSTAFYVHDHEDLLPSSEYISQLPRLEQRKYRLARLLSEASIRDASKVEDSQWLGKRCGLSFLKSPESFRASKATPALLSTIRFIQNTYLNESAVFDPNARIRQAGNNTQTLGLRDLPAQLAFRSIGYKATPLPGLTEQLNIGFNNSRGTIANDGFGRCLSPPTSENLTAERFGENVVPGCYCTGWVKNGPTGVIASTMEDAFTAADAIIDDWNSARDRKLLNSQDIEIGRYGWDGLQEDLCNKIDQAVSWDGWKTIDNLEKTRGRARDKERIKITSVPDMLKVAAGASNI